VDAAAALERQLVAIVGPTGAGKSDLAMRLAAAAACEIVSCDSLQVYRGLDIGSAKPSPDSRRQVPHHLIDVVEPDAEFSAARYADLARAALADIRGRGRLPVVVGGTGLYLRALLEGLAPGPGRDAALRRRLEGLAERHGDARLHRLLRHVDPEAAARIHARDRLRVVRALEVFRVSGRTLSQHHRAGAAGAAAGPAPLVVVVGLAPDRGELRRRVEARTREMFRAGLLQEVRGLLDRGYGPELRPLRAIGYRQALAVLGGRLSLAAAERDIVTETMRYAKRQMTWFRHQTTGVSWHATAEAALSELRGWLESWRVR
jgi:tRNA dimethylallyltransferase